jgi:hypothetical protein
MRFWPAFAVAATAGTVLTALAAGIIFRSFPENGKDGGWKQRVKG